MKRLLIFLDEFYCFSVVEEKQKYFSTSAAGSFFDEITYINKSFMFPMSSCSSSTEKFSTIIENAKVYPLPEWNSVISFLKYYLVSKKNRVKLKNIFTSAISENDIFWLRIPSVPALLFAKMILKTDKQIFLHHAGDIKNAWKNNKYKSLKKFLAFVMSKYIFYNTNSIAKCNNVVNLCTGSALTKHFNRYNTNTIFFIDSLIKKNELITKECPSKINNFIYVGRLTEDKGIKELLNVIKYIITFNPKINLKIIGFGPLEKYIIEFINFNNLKKNINFVGYIPNDKIHKFLYMSDVFILPSKAPYEGFPRVILEAWANSLIVVSTRVGGIEGLGVDKKNVLFCEKDSEDSLRNAIEKIISDKNLIKIMHHYIQTNRGSITKEYYQDILSNLLKDNNKV